MLSGSMYTREYIQGLQEETGMDPVLLEKVIYAFALLEAITLTGLRADFLEISFDKKKIYNLWEDYPDKLTPEEKELFEKENPYWALRLASEKEND